MTTNKPLSTQVIVRRWAANGSCLTVEKHDCDYVVVMTGAKGCMDILHRSQSYRAAKNALISTLDNTDALEASTAQADEAEPTEAVDLVPWLFDLHQAAKEAKEFAFAAALMTIAAKHRIIR